MELFYCKVPIGNFGDDMNDWFWDDIFPEFRDIAVGRAMFGIGSILWKRNVEQFDRILVMGSGTGVGILPDVLPEDTIIGFVRGPMTAEHFKLDPEMAISDPAICTPRTRAFKTMPEHHGDTVLVPHCGTITMPINWDRVAGRAGMRLVSPSGESKSVISEIAGASLVVTESLHGAIIADAFRVPWIAIAMRPNFNSFKWHDWAQTLGLDLEIVNLLGPMKRGFKRLKIARAKFSGTFKPAPPPSEIRFASPVARSRDDEYLLSQNDKSLARRIIRTAGPVFENILASDLRRVATRKPNLSCDDKLAENQERILSRIHTIGTELS